MFTKALAVVVVLGLGSIGCGGESATDSVEETSAEGELRTSGIKSIAVNRSGGFRPPPQPGRCNSYGSWEVDFTSKKLTGQACLDDQREVMIDVALDAAQFAKVKAAVSGVRITGQPASCPTDVPTASMTVVRARSEVRYADSRSVCWMPGYTPVKDATMRSLVDVLESLSAPALSTLQGTLRELPIRGATYGLETTTDTVALNLTPEQTAAFVANRVARAKGTVTWATPNGPHPFGAHRILQVDELLVCPSPGKRFDCMPPTSDGIAQICSEHGWIRDNCEDVDFVF